MTNKKDIDKLTNKIYKELEEVFTLNCESPKTIIRATVVTLIEKELLRLKPDEIALAKGNLSWSSNCGYLIKRYKTKCTEYHEADINIPGYDNKLHNFVGKEIVIKAVLNE